MVSRGVLYGVVITFVALLLISSSFALIYFSEYQQQVSQNQRYVGELDSALASYRSLSGSFNSSLQDYNRTLSLLASAVAGLNTSTRTYLNASVALSSLWSSYQGLASLSGRRTIAYEVRMLVDYGNGTRQWYNDSTVQPGWNGYVTTLVLLDGNLQATWYPQYGEHLVTGIDGTYQTASKSWFLWQYGEGGWVASQTGADLVQIQNGTMIAWTLCGYDANFNPTCMP